MWQVQLYPPSGAAPVFTISSDPGAGAISCAERPTVETLSAYGWVADVPGSWTAWLPPSPGKPPKDTLKNSLAQNSLRGIVLDTPDGGFQVTVKDSRFPAGVTFSCPQPRRAP